MNIQLEKKKDNDLLSKVANYCFWRVHWMYTNNDHLEKNMVKLMLSIEGILLNGSSPEN